MEATVYLMPLLKVTELLCGLAFISGRFVPLATVVIFPITLNILLFHTFLAPGRFARCHIDFPGESIPGLFLPEKLRDTGGRKISRM